MAVKSPDAERRIVPRWRESADAVNAGELRSVQNRSTSKQAVQEVPEFDALVSEFEQSGGDELAADLISCAIALGRVDLPVVKRAAESLAENEAHPELRRLSGRILNGMVGTIQGHGESEFSPQRTQTFFRARVGLLRQRIREYPKNAITWVDMARSQTALGQQNKARQSISVALGLAPNNRFVLRAAARFFVHADSREREENVGRGLYILRRSPLIKADPWVMAAEIALSEINSEIPRALKTARRLSREDGMAPWDLSELNGALATFAVDGGGIGPPQRFFQQSLRDPTENALAQAQWAAEKFHAITVSESLLQAPVIKPFEALALRHKAEGKWNEAIQECRDWSIMEPTSSRPLILGGYIAEVALEDGQIAAEFCERALMLAPHEPWAHNNMAVALAYLGQTQAARSYAELFDFDDLPERSIPYFYATLGLIAYREGNRDEGMRLYLKAASTSVAKEDRTIRAMILWHLLREEAHVGIAGTAELAERLWARSKGIHEPELEAMYRGIIQTKSNSTSMILRKKIAGHQHSLAGSTDELRGEIQKIADSDIT